MVNDEFRGKRVPSERSADIHFWGDPDCPIPANASARSSYARGAR